MEALSSAFWEGGPLSPFAPHGHALATLAKALVNQDPRLLERAERFQDLEAGEARFALSAAILGRPLP